MSGEESKHEIMADEESADEERLRPPSSSESTTSQTDVHPERFELVPNNAGSDLVPKNAEASARLYKETDEQLEYSKRYDLKQSYEDEYARINFRFERALIEHKLALQYFEFRAFYFVFLPVTTIATLITIIGFLISGTNQDDGGGTAASAAEGSVEFEPLVTGQSKQIWSLVVGILGAITTLLSAIGKRSNYQSQSDMHRSAVKALEKICLSVDFERERFNRNVRDLEHSEFDDGKDLNTTLGADLKTHQASFQAMLDACCDSPAPTEVVQAFNKLDSIFAKQYHLYRELAKVTNVEHDLMYFYHQLWTVFSTHWLWPLSAPRRFDVGDHFLQWKKEYGGIEGVASNLDFERYQGDLSRTFGLGSP
eukprot:scaffold1837_cov120-Skeletonema_dohrnii-CCMP3373.AAC.5